ncbi:MAG TPA: EAL domain-containing protein [Mycobacteriales bacterium]|nr:EAL domain-containing protein [Mycobacteriales bacterium]
MQERRETAGFTMRFVIDYVRTHYGDDHVARMLQVAGESRPLHVLEDEGVWSTYDQKIALFAAAAEVTDRDDIAQLIGESALSSSVGSTMKVTLALVGSPQGVLRGIPRASMKFSTVADMRAVQVTRSSAVLHYRVHDGYALSRYDCDYSIGLLSNVPALFGLPAATVKHDVCQVRGADECIYELSWRPFRRLAKRRRPELPADALLTRLNQLQDTLGDLVATSSVDEVLDTVAARAGTSVSAERFVLAARIEGREAVHVRSTGFTPSEAQQIADDLAARRPVQVGDEHAEVVDVRTATHSYGHLVAFARYPFLDHERELLEAYARLAATALTSVTALAAAEDRRQAAEALLGLASTLHRAHTSNDVASAVSVASQTVMGTDAAGVLLFDAENNTLRVAGHHGFEPSFGPLLEAMTIRPEDTPEIGDILAHPNRPRVYEPGDDPFISGLMQALGLGRIAVLTINGDERTHGVLIVGWFSTTNAPVVGPSLFARLTGLADQATSALEKAELVDRVHAQATTDALTGVANRRLLAERLTNAMLAAGPATQPALLFIDLDRFKMINDTLGHAAGDALLKVVAQRLQGCVRGEDLVARLGGDEFTVLLPSVTDAGTAEQLAERIVATLAEPVSVDGRTLHVRCSVGVLLVSSDTAGVSEALRDADAAMYAAKKAGGNRYVLFDPDRFRSDSDALDLESDLYAAVTEERLHLAFQPQVDITNGNVVAAECLVRWHDPARGLVPPDRFLPIAETTGLIVPLDLWVLRTACAQAAQWWRDGHALRLAVNVSARTLADPRFVPSVLEALESSGLSAEALEIELTEAAAIADTETVRGVLTALRDHGVSVAIDDLGTGYSSLQWITSFPVDRIKIDRSFVADLDTNGRGAPLVEAIIAMAHRLGHEVIAEGVETRAQMRRLLTLGCAVAQGFALGRPGPASAIPELHSRGVELAAV